MRIKIDEYRDDRNLLYVAFCAENGMPLFAFDGTRDEVQRCAESMLEACAMTHLSDEDVEMGSMPDDADDDLRDPNDIDRAPWHHSPIVPVVLAWLLVYAVYKAAVYVWAALHAN